MEYERRETSDDRTLGGLFFLFADEVRDLYFQSALQQLMISRHVSSENEKEQIGCFLSTTRMDLRFTQLYQGFV
ncbi:hypothetical protein J2Z28_002464 [Paenibacillus xylanexedens]|uniref:Uncharacterized protein n=1 Tax=Paenibacillus xylanexedens TaxID=528191 RepID=A0ABS4RTR0_PAEXY|nr:hypothetical protein [Paenibacillus xylanexedens]